ESGDALQGIGRRLEVIPSRFMHEGGAAAPPFLFCAACPARVVTGKRPTHLTPIPRDLTSKAFPDTYSSPDANAQPGFVHAHLLQDLTPSVFSSSPSIVLRTR